MEDDATPSPDGMLTRWSPWPALINRVPLGVTEWIVSVPDELGVIQPHPIVLTLHWLDIPGEPERCYYAGWIESLRMIVRCRPVSPERMVRERVALGFLTIISLND